MSALQKVNWLYQIYKNQGARYILYRSYYEIARRRRWLEKKFPVDPPQTKFISLEEWRKEKPAFFFQGKDDILLERKPNDVLETRYKNFIQHRIPYFNDAYYDIGSPVDWLSNPDTGFKYPHVHWTRIEDFQKDAGDIKYVWEKSRFTFLLDLIRYDYHFDADCGEPVFSTIESWMDANPINVGPNYKCSQETSIRILNWTFALYYYSEHASLTEVRFQKMMHFIYWQLHHVRNNIQFSRICVRNNHAITEVMMLYFSGLLFPFMPDVQDWKAEGKRWLEQEVEYQVYPDGTYLQFSHNYQRVLMQLLTLSIVLSDIHNESLSQTFINRSKAVINYIRTVIDPASGFLPNYGANDGALFFRLNDSVFRDFRPQLNALYHSVYQKDLFPQDEDILWLNARGAIKKKVEDDFVEKIWSTFPNGGIYTYRQGNNFTFIKCATYNDRPSHADDLHVDIWCDGENILRDAGTYKYNTSDKLVSYFTGTRSHNTVTLDENDQMQKGQRFIWFNWTKRIFARWNDKSPAVFEGEIKAFRHIADDIRHKRTVKIGADGASWQITDEVSENAGLPMKQWWHPFPGFKERYSIKAFDEHGHEIPVHFQGGYYSPTYGVLEVAEDLCFETGGKKITTYITKQNTTAA